MSMDKSIIHVNTVLSPISLCMTCNACFYCGNDCDKWIQIHHLFGIKYCSEHETLADRDCKAYMHENKQISFFVSFTIPKLKRFLDLFRYETPDNKFCVKKVHIKRSGGIIDDNWEISFNNYTTSSWFYKYKGSWVIAVCKIEGTDIISKCINLSDFIDPELMEKNKDVYGIEIGDIINDVIKTLDDEPFREEFNVYQELVSLKNNFVNYAHPSCIGYIIDHNGTERKVIMPEKNPSNTTHVFS